MDPNDSYAILGRAAGDGSFSRSVDAAIAAENERAMGLPADILADMERDIRSNPDRYPAINAILNERI